MENLFQSSRVGGALDASVTFPKLFETIINDERFGYLLWVLAQPEKVDLLNHLHSLFNQAKTLAQGRKSLKLKDFLVAIATMQTHDIRVSVEDLNVTKNAIHLSTVHRAKGREWSYVFLVHCIDSKWGNNKVREILPLPTDLLRNTDVTKKEQNEDERRLFYVGLTRARKQVVITYPDTVISSNRSQRVVGSMFVEELKTEEGQARVAEVVAPELAERGDEYLARLMTPITAKEVSGSMEAFFRELTTNFKLSSTSLDKYLRDPKEFAYDVLLRIPRTKPEPMAFGSAVHSALEKIFKEFLESSQFPNANTVTGYFEEALKKELLTSADFERRLQYGKKVITDYYQTLDPHNIKPLFIERFFGSGWSKTYLDDIPLSGKIDRIDWIDQSKKLVRVVDYKTGKAKSVNEIEGKTASANLSEREQTLPESIRGKYKRQLLFYKLLTELDQAFVPIVTEGVFEFVEPNASGKIVSRAFELKDEDVADLKDLIKEVMVEIRSLKFLELI